MAIKKIVIKECFTTNFPFFTSFAILQYGQKDLEKITTLCLAIEFSTNCWAIVFGSLGAEFDKIVPITKFKTKFIPQGGVIVKIKVDGEDMFQDLVTQARFLSWKNVVPTKHNYFAFEAYSV